MAPLTTLWCSVKLLKANFTLCKKGVNRHKSFNIAQLYGTLNFRKGGHLSGLTQQRKGQLYI